MKGWLRALGLLMLVGVVAVVVVARSAFQVAVGYGAKQLCSGVFVAGLPEDFIVSTDIHPRMDVLGPALGQLKFAVEDGVVESSLFGVSARAVHHSATGCTLHGDGEGDEALAAMPSLPTVTAPAALQSALDAAFSEPAGGGRNTLALVVSHRGEIIAERYAQPVRQGTRMQGWSMNKSLMATWIGMQSASGALDPTRPLTELIGDTKLGRWMDRRLTLLHLLQMESGLDFEERYGPGSDATNMLYRAEAMWERPAESRQGYPPGQRFSYSSGDTNLASYVWQRSLEQDYDAWIRENFSTPLGTPSLIAESDASGIQVGSSYVYLTGRDWLRVGQLWLDAWHGRSELLAQAWLRASVTARKSDPEGRYGRGFWLNTSGVAFEGVPDNAFYAGGNAGQFVVVIPELELVIVRLGLTDSGVSADMTSFLNAMIDWVPAQ